MNNNNMRCPECRRPICMRKLTLMGCNDKRVEEITGELLNEYSMHNLFLG